MGAGVLSYRLERNGTGESEESRSEPRRPSELGPEVVKSLYAHGVACAREQIRRHRWRGRKGGVLPKGYDAEGIAAEEVDKLVLGVRFGTLQIRDRTLGERERREAGESKGSKTVLRGVFTPAKCVKILYTARLRRR